MSKMTIMGATALTLAISARLPGPAWSVNYEPLTQK